tara:strand:+ start:345 stop:578 length:234 start_codon:yes stop_codon:yes gene_type:complete
MDANLTIKMGQLIIAVITMLAAAIGVWVNLNNDITKIKSRMYHLEQQDQENKIIFAKILDKLQHIELLLAENQIKSK